MRVNDIIGTRVKPRHSFHKGHSTVILREAQSRGRVSRYIVSFVIVREALN